MRSKADSFRKTGNDDLIEFHNYLCDCRPPNFKIGWGFPYWIVLLTMIPILAGCRRGGGTGEKDAKPDEEAKPTAVVETALVTVGPMETVVFAQGTLAPAQGASSRVAAVAPGRLVAVLVKEGDRVTAGQVVATIDNRPQQAQARAAVSALMASESQSRQAELSARAADTDHRNTVRQARLSLESAEIDHDATAKQAAIALQTAETELSKTRAGARPQEIVQAELAARQAKATRDRAATEQERVRFLFEHGIDAKRQLDDAQTALTVATTALASAEEQISLVKAGARPEDFRAAELKAQQAREALDQAKKAGEAKVALARSTLKQAEQAELQVAAKRQEARAARQTVGQKQADLQAAQSTASYAELRAPLTGIVIRRALNPGDMADPATPVVEISNSARIDLIANLSAQDGVRARTGMFARVSGSDRPDKSYAGRVISVGQVDPQTNLLVVRMSVANPDGSLKIGAFAQAAIVIRTNPRAVIVPKQAIVERDGKPVVYVAGEDKIAHQAAVTIGVEVGDKVEILSGIKAGGRVVRLGSFELSDGQKIETEGSKEAGGGKQEAGSSQKPRSSTSTNSGSKKGD